jgi:serine/threonine protein kinase
MKMQHIEILNPINSGRYGTVYKAFDHKANHHRAVKVLPHKRHDVDKSQYSVMRNEIANMTKMNGHKHIVHLYDVLQDDDNTYLVEEFCNGKTLCESIRDKDLSVEDKRKALTHILHAISGCHTKGIVYCDLKPSNIIYSEDSKCFKLIDFGSSIDLNKEQRSSMLLTPFYTPPEMLESFTISYAFDVWNIGIITYMLLYNKHPFFENSFDPSLLYHPLVFPLEASSRERFFIESALCTKPEDRPSVLDLIHYLQQYGIYYPSNC